MRLDIPPTISMADIPGVDDDAAPVIEGRGVMTLLDSAAELLKTKRRIAEMKEKGTGLQEDLDLGALTIWGDKGNGVESKYAVIECLHAYFSPESVDSPPPQDRDWSAEPWKQYSELYEDISTALDLSKHIHSKDSSLVGILGILHDFGERGDGMHKRRRVQS